MDYKNWRLRKPTTPYLWQVSWHRPWWKNQSAISKLYVRQYPAERLFDYLDAAHNCDILTLEKIRLEGRLWERVKGYRTPRYRSGHPNYQRPAG